MIEQLKAYQAWRRGEDTRKLSETDLTPTVIGEAIDWAIEQLEGMQATTNDEKLAAFCDGYKQGGKE